jgi:hypothetical protein
MKMRRILSLGVFVVLCSLASSWAEAGVIRHDVADANYTALASDPKYASVGRITFANNFDWANATLISDQWAITAGHVVRSNFNNNTPNNVLFTVGGNTYVSSAIYLNPGYVHNSPNNGNDIALIQLSSVVSNVTPARFYTGTNELGLTGTYVGHGRTGNGVMGQTSNSSVRRAGTNVIDVKGDDFLATWSPNVLLSDFDSPITPENTWGSATPTPLEYLPAEKDSGSGLFVDIGSMTFLTGVVSFALFDGDGLNYSYGDGIGSTRVSGHSAWIRTYVVPETSSFVMIGLALAFAWVAYGRRLTLSS